MKKLFLAITALLTLSGCKKNAEEAKPTENGEQLENSVGESSQTYTTYNEEELAALLKAKPDNDTLYVTNFFATWCQPCIMEIPHFKEAMKEMEGQKVKFTFVDVDQKEDWTTKVPEFGKKFDLEKHIVLYDMASGSTDFMSTHTATWDGNSIPFTRITKGKMTNEMIGAMVKKEDMDEFLSTIK